MQDVERLINVRRLNAVKTVQLVEQLRPLAEVTAEVLSALTLSEEQVAQFLTQDEGECSGQLKLATLPDCSWNSRSDSFGVNPRLYQWGLTSL